MQDLGKQFIFWYLVLCTVPKAPHENAHIAQGCPGHVAVCLAFFFFVTTLALPTMMVPKHGAVSNSSHSGRRQSRTRLRYRTPVCETSQILPAAGEEPVTRPLRSLRPGSVMTGGFVSLKPQGVAIGYFLFSDDLASSISKDELS